MLKLSDASAVLLAGGKSSRMGSDKGLVEFQNKPMASHILELLNTIFTEVIVISNTSNYEHSGYPVFPDSIPDKGPAAGILSAFEHVNSEWIFVIACDMPLITSHTILKLYDEKCDSDICLPVTSDGVEPLCGFYHAAIQNHLLELINNDVLKMQLVVKEFNLKLVEFNDADKLFLNFNTRADLEAWKEYGT